MDAAEDPAPTDLILLISNLLWNASADAWILQKGKPDHEFYLWKEDYVQYLWLNHGYSGDVGQ